VALHGDVAGLRERQLQHQRARVVCNAAHDVQAPRRARDDHVVLRAADLCSALISHETQLMLRLSHIYLYERHMRAVPTLMLAMQNLILQTHLTLNLPIMGVCCCHPEASEPPRATAALPPVHQLLIAHGALAARTGAWRVDHKDSVDARWGPGAPPNGTARARRAARAPRRPARRRPRAAARPAAPACAGILPAQGPGGRRSQQGHNDGPQPFNRGPIAQDGAQKGRDAEALTCTLQRAWHTCWKHTRG